MRPRFSNSKLRTLWYLLYYGSVVATGATFAMYKNGLIGKAAMIAIIVAAIAVFAAMSWWAFLAITQLVNAVKFAKADKDLKNIRQFSLAVRENRVYGVEFALTSLIVAISIKHHIIDASIFIIAVLAMFLGTYFIFMNFIKKAK